MVLEENEERSFASLLGTARSIRTFTKRLLRFGYLALSTVLSIGYAIAGNHDLPPLSEEKLNQLPLIRACNRQ
jgi:hypothetical protein